MIEIKTHIKAIKNINSILWTIPHNKIICKV